MVISSFFVFCFASCSQKTTDTGEMQKQFLEGNFITVGKIIEEKKSTELSKEQSVEIEITEAKMERIQLDFSKNESQIKEELEVWFPNLTSDQLLRWEEDKKLEMKVINGEKRYFKNAVSNLFRLDSNAKKIKENKDGALVDSLDIFCLQHTSELVNKVNSE